MLESLACLRGALKGAYGGEFARLEACCFLSLEAGRTWHLGQQQRLRINPMYKYFIRSQAKEPCVLRIQVVSARTMQCGPWMTPPSGTPTVTFPALQLLLLPFESLGSIVSAVFHCVHCEILKLSRAQVFTVDFLSLPWDPQIQLGR